MSVAIENAFSNVYPSPSDIQDPSVKTDGPDRLAYAVICCTDKTAASEVIDVTPGESGYEWTRRSQHFMTYEPASSDDTPADPVFMTIETWTAPYYSAQEDDVPEFNLDPSPHDNGGITMAFTGVGLVPFDPGATWPVMAQDNTGDVVPVSNSDGVTTAAGAVVVATIVTRSEDQPTTPAGWTELISVSTSLFGSTEEIRITTMRKTFSSPSSVTFGSDDDLQNWMMVADAFIPGSFDSSDGDSLPPVIPVSVSFSVY